MDSINKLNKINTDSIVADQSSVKQDKNEKQNPISPRSGDLAVSGGQASPRKINKEISNKLFPISDIPPEIQVAIFNLLPWKEALNACVYLRAAQLPRVLSEKIIKQYHAILEKNPSEKEIFEFYSKIKIPDNLKNNASCDHTNALVLEVIEQKKALEKKSPKFEDFFRAVLEIPPLNEILIVNDVYLDPHLAELQAKANQFHILAINNDDYTVEQVTDFLSRLDRFKDICFNNVGLIFEFNDDDDDNLFGFCLLRSIAQYSSLGTSTSYKGLFHLPPIKDCTFSNTLEILAEACTVMPDIQEVKKASEELFQGFWRKDSYITIDRASLALGSKTFEETLQIIRDTLPGLVVYQPVKITIKQEDIVGDVGGYLPLLKQIFPNGKIIVQES